MTLSDWNYRGLAAECYDLWFGEEPFHDQAVYQARITQAGGCALEVACGTGRLLLPYLRDGLQIEGVDSSAEMLAICRQKAERYAVTPVLHQQPMQALELPRKYSTIFIPYCSFQILSRREEAFEALRRFRAHLEPAGQLLVSLFVPWQDFRLDRQWRLRRSGIRPRDGATVLIHECTDSDRTEQVQDIWLRHELFRDGQLITSELRTHRLRWYHKHEFAMMLERAGFGNSVAYGNYTDAPADDRHEEIIFSARNT